VFCEFKKYLPVAPWSAAGQRPGMSHAARSPAPQDPPAARPGAGDPAMAAAPAHAPSVTKEIEHGPNIDAKLLPHITNIHCEQ